MTLLVSLRPSRRSSLGATAPALGIVLVATVVALLVPTPAPIGATSFVSPDVLIVHSAGLPNQELEDWAQDLAAAPAIGDVRLFDAQGSTPNSADLNGIEVVIVHSNLDFADTNATGDLLADFVDQGGRVIEMAYAFACTADNSNGPNTPILWGLGGRWESAGYAALVPSDPRGGACARYEWPSSSSMQVVAPSSPYMSGVGNIDITTQVDMNTGIVVAQDATLLATWTSPANEPMVAVGDNCVMGVNVFPPSVPTYSASTQSSILTLISNLATLECTPIVASTTTTSTTQPETTGAPAPTPTVSTSSTTQPGTTGAPVPTPTISTIERLPVSSSLLDGSSPSYPGASFTTQADGFEPLELVQLIVASDPTVVSSGFADSMGRIVLTGSLPESLEPGAHTVALYAPASGIGFRQAIQVSAPALPVTGTTSTDSGAMTAVWLLLGGTLLVVIAGRRRIN